MISSMTGYGCAGEFIGGREICVEIRSVNHRFFEFSARLPRSCGYMEEKLKALVYKKASRGKIDLSLSIYSLEAPGAQVNVNTALAAEYLNALRALGRELGVADDIALASLARFHDIFLVRASQIDEDSAWAEVSQVTEKALEKCLAMRAAEGEKLKQDVESRLELILGYVGQIEERAPKIVESYRERLYQKLCEVLENRQIDEQRILTEAAVFAEKTAVAEEITRLRSHIGQLKDILDGGQAVGRKLDFLVQELNREANTIGSKAQDIAAARLVVEIKSEIEKIREQIQNIE